MRSAMTEMVSDYVASYPFLREPTRAPVPLAILREYVARWESARSYGASAKALQRITGGHRPSAYSIAKCST